MSLNTAAAVATLNGLTAKFDQRVRIAQPFYPNLCTTVPSTGRSENYGVLGSLPGVQEWIGDRQFGKLKAGQFELINKEWENSLEIERNDIEDDRLGMYSMVFQELGDEAASHPDELLFTLVQAASAQPTWDGQYFFDTDHEWGDSGQQSNDIEAEAAVPAAPTAAEMNAAFHLARKTMINFKKDNGKPFIRPTLDGGLNKLLMLVPPDLEKPAADGINSAVIDNTTNIVLNRPRIVACPFLTSGTVFYLFWLGGVLKPFVFQARRPLQRSMKGLTDREFKNVKFMTDARYNIGFLAWWTAVRVELVEPDE